MVSYCSWTNRDNETCDDFAAPAAIWCYHHITRALEECGALEADDAGAHETRKDAQRRATDVEKNSAEPPKRCNATTRSHKPCRIFALRGRDRCMNHVSGADTHAAALRANRASAIARRSPSDRLLEAVLSLTDRASIQAVLDILVRLELAGRISHQRATVIVRACSIAARNFDRSRDTLTGPTPQQHDWFGYFEKVQSLLATVDPLLDEATKRDVDTADV